ncbi:MAG: tRNA-specific adenosine deaminase [Planctomycetota bacterium]|nr:MAG: tRNA-specific adenosine deaminase [Planctomycetota bacterium]
MNPPRRFSLELPAWVDELCVDPERSYAPEERMALAVELSARNVRAGSGGPFGAAVFEQQSGRLIAPGVNLVVSSNCTLAHAEVVALMLAQQALGTWDLGSREHDYELVASTEPCVQCFGAVHWAGLAGLVCGARDEDARAIGFDEGPKRDDWPACLEASGVTVTRDVQREAARAVLLAYQADGGPIYNAGHDDD